jgi:hypothetical protein
VEDLFEPTGIDEHRRCNGSIWREYLAITAAVKRVDCSWVEINIMSDMDCAGAYLLRS